MGKTICARELFGRLSNSAWLDGDDVWRVNPFSIKDPRLRAGDRNMSFVLQTYLQSQFDYVIFSSVVLTDERITNGILDTINVGPHDIIFFSLVCDPATLKSRSLCRDSVEDPGMDFLNAARRRDSIGIDTTGKTPKDVADEMMKLTVDPGAAGLIPVTHGDITEWKLPGGKGGRSRG